MCAVVVGKIPYDIVLKSYLGANDLHSRRWHLVNVFRLVAMLLTKFMSCKSHAMVPVFLYPVK
jgi:hypothetical protein